MSKLNDLIAELCPDGVEYKPLGEIAEIRRGVRVVKSQLAKEGKYPVYQNSLTPLGYYEKYNCPPSTTFVISAGAAGEVGYSFQEFWAADDCLYIEDAPKLSSRFLYHVLLMNQPFIRSNVRKASVPRLSRTVIEKLKIPVPPLEVQREIVRILDSFTELTAELTAELVARKQQYEYYRDLLLTFDKVEFKTLGEIANLKTGTKPKNIISQAINNYYPYINAGTTPSGYVKESNRSGGVITTPSRGQGGIGFVGYQDKPFWLGSLCYGITVKNPDFIVNKYLYYCLCSSSNAILKLKNEGGTPALNSLELGTIKIPVPPLEEQERIVKILDRFDKLCNDLSEGLPAEIEARQKQYEYYRDKLLLFGNKQV